MGRASIDRLLVIEADWTPVEIDGYRDTHLVPAPARGQTETACGKPTARVFPPAHATRACVACWQAAGTPIPDFHDDGGSER